MGSGETYIFDDCSELVRLPTRSFSGIYDITMSGSRVLGIGLDNTFYNWGPAVDITERDEAAILQSNECPLSFWRAKVFGSRLGHSLSNFGGCQTDGRVAILGDRVVPYQHVGEFIGVVAPGEEDKPVKRRFESKHQENVIRIRLRDQ
jgi:hypothetical protein